MRAGVVNSAGLISVLVVLAGITVPRAIGAEAHNVVVNGDFGEIEDGKPLKWEISGDPKTVSQTLAVVEDEGNPCARLACTRCEGKGGWTHAMICQVGGVKLREGKTYAFSCRAKAESIGSRNVSVSIQDTEEWRSCGFQTQLAVAATWKTFNSVFKATQTAHESTRLQFWFNETGTLYLDDVRIAEISTEKVEFTSAVPDIGARNLVPNGSFEIGGSGWSSVGSGAGWGNLAVLHGRIETSGAAHGAGFLRVPLGGGDTPVLCFDYYEPVVRRQTRVLAANIGWIPVRKGGSYTLSCSMRASRNGARAVLGVRAGDPERGRWDRRDHTRTVTLTSSWKRYAHSFTPACPYAFVTIGPDLAGEESVYVDIDAVQLEAGSRPTEFEPRLPIEPGIEPSAPAGVFTFGEKACLTVSAFNNLSLERNVKVGLDAVDFFDERIDLPDVALDVPAHGKASKAVQLPLHWRGFYLVRASWVVDGNELSADLRLAIVPQREVDDSVLGINHAFVTPYLIRLAGKAGITWYRDWSLKWQHIEPAPGEYNWHLADAQVNRVIAERAHLTALLPPFPSADWNTEAPAGIPGKGYPQSRLPAAWAPKEPAKLGEFAEMAVARYKDRIRVWEFLNEPIYTTYALPGKGKASLEKYGGKRYDCTDYVRLLETASAGMRRADPSCRVMGGIGGGPDTLTGEVIDAGCLRYVDIFNLHIYPGRMAPEGFIPGMNKLLALMDRHGGRKPVWITEFSYYGADVLPRAPFIPDSNSWAEERLLSDERECAEFTVRFCAVMLARGVKKVFIHSGASGSVNTSELECCLFGYGGVPRRVFPALAMLTEIVGPEPLPKGEKILEDGTHCFAFETGNRAALVLWNAEQESGSRVEVRARGATPCDIMGRKLDSGGILLSGTPIYVVGPAGSAEELLAGVSFSVE